MHKTFATVKAKVKDILEHYTNARDNDIILYCIYLNKYHGLKKAIGKENYKKLRQIMIEAPFPESIRRTRQKIQEQGELVGERRSRRMEEADTVRRNIHKW